MNRFDRLAGGSDLRGGFVVEDCVDFEGVGLVEILTAGAGCCGGVPEVEGGVVACPMVRAVSETESDFVFSRICFCFSSSLVKIGTRSSGMGFLSCNGRSDQSDSAQGQEIVTRS